MWWESCKSILPVNEQGCWKRKKACKWRWKRNSKQFWRIHQPRCVASLRRKSRIQSLLLLRLLHWLLLLSAVCSKCAADRQRCLSSSCWWTLLIGVCIIDDLTRRTLRSVAYLTLCLPLRTRYTAKPADYKQLSQWVEHEKFLRLWLQSGEKVRKSGKYCIFILFYDMTRNITQQIKEQNSTL